MASMITNLAGGSAMKKLLLGTAISTVMVAGAAAADLDVKAPPPAWGWTGCYLGANVGGGFAYLSDTDTLAGPPPQVFSNTPGVIGGGGRSVTTDCHDAFGATGGAFSAPRCWTGTTLMGVSSGLQWRF